MKIFSPEQIRRLDRATINREPISSLDLMERAAINWLNQLLSSIQSDLSEVEVIVICGSGNNGGDGWVMARELLSRVRKVTVLDVKVGTPSSDNAANQQAFKAQRAANGRIISIATGDALPVLSNASFVIDALFGSGLNRPVTGYWAKVIDWVNEWQLPVYAVDLPSGLMANAPTSSGAIVRANRTLTFQLPKLVFFTPEAAQYVGDWDIVEIGLDQDFIEAEPTAFSQVEAVALQKSLHLRGRYDHKGTFGHALIMAGSHGKIGAATLSAKAALRAGAGLVSVHLPRCGYEIMQISFPEAMCSVDRHRFLITEAPNLNPYAAIGVGPGIGTNDLTVSAIRSLLKVSESPMVIDADALNILGLHPGILATVPQDSILTPHPKEFARLFGETTDSFSRWETQREKAQEMGLIIILKGGHTSIALPNGQLIFNTTGNPGMGTAGTGDVLTGILTGLLAQGYNSEEAALLGVYLHGLAGDLAAAKLEQESVLASDVIQYLGQAFHRLRSLDQ